LTQKLDCLGRSCFFFPFSGTARSLQNRFVSVAVSPRGRDQWERSVRVSGSGETLGLRDPVEDEAKGRSGLGPFLHPPSRKTPTPFFVKMFAVAAQTTVRATAQVKATKVAAKEQKSAYVPSRFPASSISRRFFHPRRSAASALRRGDDDDESRAAFARGRVAHRRVSIPRVSHAATVARVFARRLRARPRRANNEIVETSRADETLTFHRLCSSSDVRSSLSSKAAGAAAALFLFASPAAFADGLTLQNGTNSAPGKYEQPFYDPRPVVEVEKDSSADISTEAARVAANKQKGMKNCKTITGAPCVGSTEISSM